jgi:hypothetical protein
VRRLTAAVRAATAPFFVIVKPPPSRAYVLNFLFQSRVQLNYYPATAAINC